MAYSERQTFIDVLDTGLADAAVRIRDRQETVIAGGRGTTHRDAPPFTLQVHDQGFYRRVLGHGNLGLGEAFVENGFEMTAGQLEDFIGALLRNRVSDRIRGHVGLMLRAGGIRLKSVFAGKATNISRHYDVGVDLFESFLDPTMTYSCGYARTPDDTLECLQQTKLNRICGKLRLRPGDRVLDIGCGFGGLLIHAATHHGIHGVGITNSQDHARIARDRVAAAGLSSAITIQSGDYAAVEGRFDKVVSVGMMEHVPRSEYRRYVRTIRRVLSADGLGLIHTIGCIADRNRHDPFIQKYIFPGSNQPRLSEIALALEREAMPIFDVENMARHYYHTVRQWLVRFRANRDRLDAARYPPAFQRVWEYYLCCGVAAALWSDSALFQVLFGADCRQDIPLIRV